MDRDKALIRVGGEALAAVAADALRGAGASEVVVIGGDADRLADLGLRTLPDRWPGEGPLGGVITALEAAPSEVVVVLACDLPQVTAEAVRVVVAGLGPDADAAVGEVGGRPQWLVGAWRRTALRELHAAFEAGERAMWRAARALRVGLVTLRDETWAADVDTPADLFGYGPPG